MHIIWEVQNAIHALSHKTYAGCGESMHYLHMGMKKSNYKEILNMKYLCKGIKPLFMVVDLMKFDAFSISYN
jgi:hypothetical protein